MVKVDRKDDVRVQSLTFNSRIPDDIFSELVAPGEILRIKRGAWISFVEFRRNADTLVLNAASCGVIR